MSKKQKPEKSQRIKHRQGLNNFLALGPDRSLDKLHDWYIKNVSKPPGRSIIGIWSTKHGWQTRAAEHDSRVAGGVSQKVEEAAIEENWDCVGELTELAQRSVKKALDALKDDTMKVKDPYGIAALTNIVLGCVKAIELLEGRATDRLDNLFPKDCVPEWVAEKLTRMAAEKTNEASAPTTAANRDEAVVPETVH